MKYGGAVALIVIGAILYFAVNVEVAAVDISLIGLLCMIAGAAWLVINLIFDKWFGCGKLHNYQRSDSVP